MTYEAIHAKLRSTQGPARDHQCNVCDEPAYDWAYQHTGGMVEQYQPTSGRPFSMRVEDYRPMCRACHSSMDLMMDERLAKRVSDGAKTARANDQIREELDPGYLSRKAVAGAAEAQRLYAEDSAFYEMRVEQNRQAGATPRACEICRFEGNGSSVWNHQQSVGHGKGYDPERCCSNGRCRTCRGAPDPSRCCPNGRCKICRAMKELV